MKYKSALLSSASVLFVVLCFLSASCTYAQTDPQPLPPPETKAGTVKTNSMGIELVWIPPGEFMIARKAARRTKSRFAG